jgi:hypothetical protein
MPPTLMGFPSSEVFPPDQPVYLSANLPLLTFFVDASPWSSSVPSSSPDPLRRREAFDEGPPQGIIPGESKEILKSRTEIQALPLLVLSPTAPSPVQGKIRVSFPGGIPEALEEGSHLERRPGGTSKEGPLEGSREELTRETTGDRNGSGPHRACPGAKAHEESSSRSSEEPIEEYPPAGWP